MFSLKSQYINWTISLHNNYICFRGIFDSMKCIQDKFVENHNKAKGLYEMEVLDITIVIKMTILFCVIYVIQ